MLASKRVILYLSQAYEEDYNANGGDGAVKL